MGYKRLPFEQYFINSSEDYNRTGKTTRGLTYTGLEYPCKGLLHRLAGIRHEVNFEIHYEPDRDAIQINFEKTMGASDWFANVVESGSEYYDAISFEGKPLQLRVHTGWAEMYLAAKRVIRRQWQLCHDRHPAAETEIIGWSLGSGQAMLCAQDLNYNFGLRSHVFTYGSVRPFQGDGENDESLRRYLDTLCAECWNFSDVNDVISYMPPFKHWMAIRRVDVETEDRTALRLMNPWKYHAYYDDPALYEKFETAEKNC